MDPNKGHGENIRTYNWREKGRRSIGRSRIAASRRPNAQTWDRTAFIFPLTADECAPVADMEAQRTKGVRDPVGPGSSWATQRKLSSAAKQNDKVPQGN